MTKEQENLLKRSKLMVIDDKVANEIDRLSKKMKTNRIDVLLAGLELLKLSLGKNISINEPGSNAEIKLPVLSRYEPDRHDNEKI